MKCDTFKLLLKFLCFIKTYNKNNILLPNSISKRHVKLIQVLKSIISSKIFATKNILFYNFYNAFYCI